MAGRASPIRIHILLTFTALTGTLLALVVSGHRNWLMPGVTSDGHHLIESKCASCHQGFSPPSNANCLTCHREDLAHDTHPASTFEDPRWVAELQHVDARNCRSCHAEHRDAKRLSVSIEICSNCHDDVVQKLASHRTFSASSCADGGCHNYHDNTALDASFLRKHMGPRATFRDSPLLTRTASREETSKAPV